MNTFDNMDNFCNFISKDLKSFECINCGRKIRSETEQSMMPIFLCDKTLKREDEDGELTFAQKIKNFAKASIDHMLDGMPMCTEEQIIQRHNICLGCEYFKDDTCTKCGCPLIRNKQFVSKLAWADQECPVGKWGKIIN
jgi:hypothetical protein